MNKSQLVEAVATNAGISKVDTEEVLKALVSTIHKEVKNGNKIVISGLGSFEKVERSARTGVNPATGQKIEIAAKSAPKFKAAKGFKDSLL